MPQMMPLNWMMSFIFFIFIFILFNILNYYIYNLKKNKNFYNQTKKFNNINWKW